MRTSVGGVGGGGDPMVRPPPQTVDDLEDLTGEPQEVHHATPPPANGDHMTSSAATRVIAPTDRRKVHHCCEPGTHLPAVTHEC